MRKYINSFSVANENGENLYYGPYVSVSKDNKVVFPGDKDYPNIQVTVTAYDDNTGEEEEYNFSTRTLAEMGM